MKKILHPLGIGFLAAAETALIITMNEVDMKNYPVTNKTQLGPGNKYTGDPQFSHPSYPLA
ncbi:MAG: hypothetical protein KAS04_04340 [Candidatus Aenigmarchaeota archaeon]|nr:hypothetical protein [Candidatus Aenigmarchaeota archaeon]